MQSLDFGACVTSPDLDKLDLKSLHPLNWQESLTLFARGERSAASGTNQGRKGRPGFDGLQRLHLSKH